MSLLREYNSSRQNRGLKSSDDFKGFSYNYYRFFYQFSFNHDLKTLYFRHYSDYDVEYSLSKGLFLKCSHHFEACYDCMSRPSCGNSNYCPCPRCYKSYTDRGVKIFIPLGDREEAVLDLLEFAYSQLAWVVKFKTQNQIRQNSSRMKEECRRRINFFIDKIEEKEDLLFPRDLSFRERSRILSWIRETRDDLGF